MSPEPSPSCPALGVFFLSFRMYCPICITPQFVLIVFVFTFLFDVYYLSGIFLGISLFLRYKNKTDFGREKKRGYGQMGLA